MVASLRTKGDRYYAVISYKDGGVNKQKWVALGLPVKNNKRKAESMLDGVLAEFEEELARKQAKPVGTPYAEYLKDWLEKKKPFVELSTWEGYQTYVERHVIPYFEKLSLSVEDLKPKHIQDYYNYKYTEGRLDGKPGGLSIPSIKKHSIVIKESLDDAVLREIIPRNPAVGVKLPAKDVATKERTFLTAESANELLKAFDGHPLQAIVYVTLYYGLRRSEVLGLRWSSIDFEKNTLTINHTVVKNKTIVEKDTTKTQASYHTYVLIDDVKRVLLERYNNRCAFNTSDYVFTWPDGTLMRPDSVTRSFQRVLKNHGLKPMRFHDLRHSTASVLLDMGWDIMDIKTWLRHANVSVTSDIYTHITEERKAKMANDLNSLFSIGKEQDEESEKN